MTKWQDFVVDGEKAVVKRLGKEGVGFIEKTPDGRVAFRIEGDEERFTMSAFCKKLSGPKTCDGKNIIRVLRDGKWVTLANLGSAEDKKETRAEKIVKQLLDGESVFLAKGPALGKIVKSEDGIRITPQGSDVSMSVSAFCKHIKGTECDGYAALYVERNDIRIRLENLVKEGVSVGTVRTVRAVNAAKTVKTVKRPEPKLDKIAHLLHDGTPIFVKSTSGFHSGKIYSKHGKYVVSDDTDEKETSMAQFCKRYLEKGECDIFEKLYLVQGEKKTKLQNLRDASGVKFYKAYQNKTARAAMQAVRSPNSNKRSLREKRESFHRRNTQKYEERGAEREGREHARLYQNLTRHVRKGKIQGLGSKAARMEFIASTLKQQKNTCYLSDVSGAYCWDVVNPAKYLKLEWAHIMPTCQKKLLGGREVKENLALMCSRCNQNLQSGRRLDQLPMEFLTKTRVLIDKLNGYPAEAKEKIMELIHLMPRVKAECESK